MEPESNHSSHAEQQFGAEPRQSAETPRPGLPRGRPFVKGQSGNPAGRPSRVRLAAVVAEGLIGRKTVALTNKLISLALAGDRAALRLCLERITPLKREQPIELGLPPIEGAADLGRAMAAVVNAAATGAITSRQAAALARAVTTFVRAIDAADFEKRLQELEAQYAAEMHDR